jgi:hypothetical protein
MVVTSLCRLLSTAPADEQPIPPLLHSDAACVKQTQDSSQQNPIPKLQRCHDGSAHFGASVVVAVQSFSIHLLSHLSLAVYLEGTNRLDSIVLYFLALRRLGRLHSSFVRRLCRQLPVQMDMCRVRLKGDLYYS